MRHMITRTDWQYKITQHRYYMTGRKVKSFVIGDFKYRWMAWLYKFWFYDLAEPVYKATVDWHIEKCDGVKSWTVDVFDDCIMGGEHRRYKVPAADGNDAMLMAFILDKGFEDNAYGHSHELMWGAMELAKTHCRVAAVENYHDAH